MPVTPFNASKEETLMMHLERGFSSVRSSRCLFCRRDRTLARNNARDVRIAPSRFVARIFEISTGSVLGRILEIDIPAALTRTSTFSYIEYERI